MNHSGDAAEQIVRMSLEGAEFAARITGTAAKEIAVLLLVALKNIEKNPKLRGKARLTSMLKSGKALEIFSVKESDLKQFAEGAKQYGIVYCVLRSTKNSPDGICDIMVKAEDAPKINRLIERYNFSTVDKARIESELVAAKAEKSVEAQPAEPNKDNIEPLLDDLMGKETEKPGKEATASSPFASNVKTPNPSAPTSGRKNNPVGYTNKPSVKEELREIKAAKKEQEAAQREETPAADKPKDKAETTHQQPQGGKKSKTKNTKART